MSRPLEDVVEEARLLAARGVRELVVIGQDTTSYGLDSEGKRRLPELLERIADVEGIRWVRLMYAYPAAFPLETLDILARHPALCKYLDVPVQHAADRVLRSMRRGISKRALLNLLETIRTRVPGIALRTTLIVGYPDEGEQEFDELLEFVENVRFERLGVFQYSQEEGTVAYPLGDPVPGEEKARRHDMLMALQRDISLTQNRSMVGTRQSVLVDRQEGDVWFGRTQYDAPEIDNEVIIHSSKPVGVGTFCDVEIVQAYEYDITGNVLSDGPGG
jgi:ribosomal protein S12 methylthiotransferase